MKLIDREEENTDIYLFTEDHSKDNWKGTMSLFCVKERDEGVALHNYRSVLRLIYTQNLASACFKGSFNTGQVWTGLYDDVMKINFSGGTEGT